MERIKNALNKRLMHDEKAMGLNPEDEPAEIEAANTVKSDLVAKHATLNTSRSLPLNNPHREKEILESMEPIYYKEENFDPSAHELKKLPEILDVQEMSKNRVVMRQQLSVVSKKISDLILENHPSYAAELKKVTELQRLLNNALSVCTKSRRNLQRSQVCVSSAGLRLLANHRKLMCLKKLYNALQSLKTLHETEFQLRELIEDGNYPAAIQLCLECMEAAQTYSHYCCIGEMSSKLADTLEQMENELERALDSVIVNFDPDRYRQILFAYNLLDKGNTVAERLLGHVCAAVDSSTLTVLLNTTNATDTSDITELCKRVPSEMLIECLREVCCVIWRILYCVHSVMRYHVNVEEAVTGKAIEHQNLSLPAPSDSDPAFIRKSLELGLGRIWQVARDKVVLLLQSTNLTGFKFDKYLEIVDITNGFSDFGVKHFGTQSEAIIDLMEEHTRSYFKHYHRARLEELRLFLEAEGWTHCPVNKGFNIFQLHEFEFLKRSSTPVQSRSPDSKPVTQQFWLIDQNAECPFDLEVLTSEQNGGASPSVDGDSVVSDDDDEVKREFVEDGVIEKITTRKQSVVKSAEKMAPILCNTALNLMRLFGRYLHMMTMLKTVAFEAVTCLWQLFDYYLYTVCDFFGSDNSEIGCGLISSKLAAALKRIENTLVLSKRNASYGAPDSRLCQSQVSPSVQLNDGPCLFALAERTVGVESLVFVAKQLHALQSALETFLPLSKRPFLQQFYTQTVSVASDVRRAVYGSVASKALNYQQLLQNVAAANWDINELMSQHNQYVDILVQDFESLAVRLAQLRLAAPLPREAYNTLYEIAILCSERVLLEGYATPGRKCSNEGRALMQLDFQQLVRKLETATELKPIPYKELVENYIKAYYLPESAIEQWITEHKETYNPRQLITLLNVATHISKKTRQKLISSLEGFALS